MDACPQCVDLLAANLHIIGAAASVGIERGLTTAEVVQQYAAVVHRREGHDS